MTFRYLLDTNALSEPTRPIKNLSFMRRLSLGVGQLATSSISVAEVAFGLELMPQGKRRSDLQTYYEGLFASVPVLSFDEPTARTHGRIRGQLQKAGRTAPFADSMVAAVALTHGLTLVTANVLDFRAIPGLHLEDWTDHGSAGS